MRSRGTKILSTLAAPLTSDRQKKKPSPFFSFPILSICPFLFFFLLPVSITRPPAPSNPPRNFSYLPCPAAP